MQKSNCSETEETLLLKWFPHIDRFADFDEASNSNDLYLPSRSVYFSEKGKITFLLLNDLPHLTKFPPFFIHFTSLVCLSVNDCELESLINLPSTLSNLMGLFISHTPLQSLTGLPKALPKLKLLNLRYTLLKSLKGLPPCLPNLLQFKCYHNHLTTLIGFPHTIPKLEYLEIDHNSLLTLEGFPAVLPELKDLTLTNNLLKTLPITHHRCPRLQSFSGQLNPINSLHGMDPVLLLDTRDTPYFYPILDDRNFPKGTREMLATTPMRTRQDLYDHWAPLMKEYELSLPELIHHYCHDLPLSPFQEQRIVYEGTHDDLYIIQKFRPNDKKILPALSRHLKT